jgi:tripartite-type tricarboxylate transporter receptor subunit TctC
MRLRLAFVFATLMLAALPAAAQNQEPGKERDKTAFTGKTISIVVPFSPGAVSDPLARLIAPRLAEALGANVIVENKAGANTNLGNVHVARSQPDGHTLLLAGTALTVNVAFYKDKLPFDPLKDFTPITLLAVTNSALVVNPSVAAKTLGELIALLKSKPGALNYASAGSGNMTHLVMEFFKLKAGVDVTHVPYRGAGPALNDVIAGHASMMVISPGPLEPYIASGKLRALAITGIKRHDLLPDVPTFNEAGVPMPEVDYGTTFGMLGPAGLPPETLATLNKALTEVLAEPELRRKLKSAGFEPSPTTPQQYGDILRGQVEKWPPLIERAGISLN